MARTSPVNTGYTIINGTTSGSNGSKVDTWIEYKVTSQSVADNTSTIRVILYSAATKSSSTSWESAENFGYVGYNNANKQYLNTTYDFSNYRVNKFGDHTYTIAHNSDGTKTITLQGSWSTSHSSYISGGTVPASGVSSSVTLPQIARASSVSNFTGTLGSAGTITITRASSSFTHTLQYSFDNSNWTDIATGVGTSYSWTPNVSLISNFSNQKTKTGYIRCITYSGGTNVGSKTSTMTLSVPSTTLGSVSATIGKSVTLTATNPCASGLTYQFAYSNGSTWTNIGSAQTGKTISWSIPTSLIGNISNAKSKGFSIRVITKIGSVEVNTATATATLTIPANTSQNITGTIGSAVSIPITKAHSNLTSTIAYSFGSSGTTTIVTTTTSTSYSWTPPTSLLTQIPNSISGTGSITITTYNGSASCGSNTYTLTLSAATSVVPTSSLSLTRINNNSTVNGWGIYLQGYSQVQATLTGSGVSGSTIKSMSISGTGLSSSSSPSTASATLTGTSSVLQTSGRLYYRGNVSDSRNRSATEQTKYIDVISYSQPSVSGVSLVRSNAQGNIDTRGTWLKVAFTLNYSTADDHNSASVSLRYKEATASSWTTYGTVTNGANLNLNLDVSKNYQAQLLVSDSLNSNIASATFNIPSAERVLNVNGSGSGLAIGGFSTDAGKLQVYYPADFEGDTLPTINTKNNIAYYTDTHISATNYNSIEAFYDALPSSVQTSVWCGTATDRPMASGGMVTVFKEDNSYGYVVFHGIDGTYFTKRKTGGVWQSWITLMIGSLNGTNLTTSYSMTGNIAMGDISRFLTAKTYTTSSDDYFNFAKALCDDWVAKDTGTYVAKISWANITWGIAIILVQQNTYIAFEWLSPYDTIIRGQLWNNTYTATLVKQRADLIQATGTNISVPANTWTTICSITLPSGTASLVGSVLNLPASNTWNNGDLVSARFSGQDFVRTSCHPWGNNTGQASMCFTEHVINNSHVTVALQIWSSKAFTFTGTGRLQASMRSRWTTGN